MKLSDAILAGCKKSLPVKRAYHNTDANGNLCCCALGAAALGTGLLFVDNGYGYFQTKDATGAYVAVFSYLERQMEARLRYLTLEQRRAIATATNHEAHDIDHDVLSAVAMLNDCTELTREQIAAALHAANL